MSLIVVRREGGNIVICSDTKLTYPDIHPKRSTALPREGILKSVVISPNICVSFGNVVDYAEEVIGHFPIDCSTSQVVDLLLRAHRQSNGETDFIVCIGGIKPIIYEIKDGEANERVSAWIGSKRGFNYFQKALFEKDKIKPLPGTNIEMIEALSFIPLFQRMSDAFDKVIQNDGIPEVGGFKVNMVWQGDRFYYPFYVTLSRDAIELKGPGGSVIGHESAEKGGYSVHFIGASEDNQFVALHVKQGKFGIVYSRGNNGYLRPRVYEGMDEVDFIGFIAVNYQIVAKLSTQDASLKYYEDGMALFKKFNWLGALQAFESSLLHAKGNGEAEALLAKGVTLLNLKQISKAMAIFQMLVVKFPSFQHRVNAVFAQAHK